MPEVIPPSPLARHRRSMATATAGRLSRRDFVRSAGIAVAGVATSFSFVRTATARTDRLHRFLQGRLAECNTPGIAVAVVRGDEIVFADGVGWADREHALRVTPQTP